MIFNEQIRRLVSSPATVKSKSLIAVCTSSKRSIQCKWLYAVLYSLMKNMPFWLCVQCKMSYSLNKTLQMCTVKIESGLRYKSFEIRLQVQQSQVQVQQNGLSPDSNTTSLQKCTLCSSLNVYRACWCLKFLAAYEVFFLFQILHGHSFNKFCYVFFQQMYIIFPK